MSVDLEASYRHCQQISRRSASSFYYSFLLLPKPQRLAMCALYAFLRRTDDLGDSNDSVDARRVALAQWRDALDRSLAGQHADPLLPALSDTVGRFAIPLEHLHAAIDGVEMDLDPRGYRTFEELQDYCYRVASVVGLSCLKIWGCSDARAQEPARQCGIAFQLTNILRDLKEDAASDRVYLPAEDLERFGYRVEDLKLGVRDERFRRLMRFEIERAEALYLEAMQLEVWLEPVARRVFGSMVAVYRALLAEIKRLDGDVLSTRVRLSRWRKMRIATRFWLQAPTPSEVRASVP